MQENVTKVNQSEVTTATEAVLLGTLKTITSIINETVNSALGNFTPDSSTKHNLEETTLKDQNIELNIGITSVQEPDNNFHQEVWFWIFGIYIGNIALGLIFNGISFVALLKTKRNGTLSIVTQLTSIDIFSSWVCIVELLSIKRNAWTFPSEVCPLFAGSETLCNTLTLYLIISLNYHTISLTSLCNIKTLKTTPTGSCDASQECLVRDVTSAQSSTSTSTTTNVTLASNSTNSSSTVLTSKRSNAQQDISVVIPCILIWFTCLSLSIPQLTLSSTIESYSTKNVTCTCTLMDDSKILINLLALFRVFIPGVLITSSLCILVFKLVQSVRNDNIPAIFTKKCHNIVYYLIFCLVLNVLYICTSSQRLILYAMHAYASPTIPQARIYKLPPLFNVFTGSWVAIALCMLHYSGIFLRFLVYVFLLPKFKSILCNNFLTCFKPKEL